MELLHYGLSSSPPFLICYKPAEDLKGESFSRRSFRGFQGGWEVLPHVAAATAVSVTADTTESPRVWDA